MKLLEEIKIEGENRETIKVLTDQIDESRALIDYSAMRLNSNQKRLFEIVDELYPQLVDYRVSINHETLIIRIVGLKNKTEK